MKKFLSLLIYVLCFAALTLTGCQGKSDSTSPSSSAQQETYLKLKNSNEILTLGDRVELTVSYNEIDGEQLSWFSSKPDVVSVDENGVVEALKVGKSTVTVRYGEKEATCEIESGLSGNIPVLAFNNNMREEITLMKSSEYDFGAHIRFNGKTFLASDTTATASLISVSCAETTTSDADASFSKNTAPAVNTSVLSVVI